MAIERQTERRTAKTTKRKAYTVSQIRLQKRGINNRGMCEMETLERYSEVTPGSSMQFNMGDRLV